MNDPCKTKFAAISRTNINLYNIFFSYKFIHRPKSNRIIFNYLPIRFFWTEYVPTHGHAAGHRFWQLVQKRGKLNFKLLASGGALVDEERNQFVADIFYFCFSELSKHTKIVLYLDSFAIAFRFFYFSEIVSSFDFFFSV